MRIALVLAPALVVAAPFAACGGSTPSAAADAGADTGTDGTTSIPVPEASAPEAPPADHCALDNGTDPVGLCVQQLVLEDLHAHAFSSGKGAAASWSSATLAPDKGDAGAVTYSLDDTVAYASAAAEYLASALVYGNSTIDGVMTADLLAVAYQLESSFVVPDTEYGGELYLHLRTVAGQLNTLQYSSDARKLNLLADAYARSIFTQHYHPLGTLPAPGTDGGAPAHDGGQGDAASGHDGASGHDAASDGETSAHDAGPHDAGAGMPDGIIGNVSGSQVAYSPGDVATAVYALLDMVARNPTDASVSAWLAAARASLDHLEARAKEPTTGMFYTSLLTNPAGDGGAADLPAPTPDPSVPVDALLADTQATFALAMVRAQALVTSDTVAHLTGTDGATGPVTDAGVTGPFVPILDVPFEALADSAMSAMNGAHSLWDATPPDAGTGYGYMDGYIPSSKTFITSKSTRPNALMAAAVYRAFLGGDALFRKQLRSLLQLLVEQQSITVPLGSSFLSVIPAQVAYFRAATRGFTLLDSGTLPASYTTAAVTAAVEGLNEQLVGVSP